ncbi:MAG: PAS domain-containing protein, partial [Candidatus Eisenbacteria bacterium]
MRSLCAGGRFLAARAAVGALVALLVLLLGEPGAPVPRHGVSVGVLAWVAAGTWLLGAAGPLRRRPEGAFGLLLTGDSLAAAAAAWAAGGVAAPALLLIALPVLAGGLLFQCRVGLLLGALAGVLCGVLAWKEGLPAGQGLWTAIAYHGAVFIAVGLGAGLLGRRMAASLREAAATRRELEEVRLSTDCIVESLASGLIAIDAQGRIGTVNAEARRLLGFGRLENPGPALESRNAALLDRIRKG